MKLMQELKAFLLRGNVVELAVGVIMGASFGAVTASLAGDVLTPLIGAIFGHPDFSKLQLGPVMIGKLINAVLNFVLVGTSLFFVIKLVNRLAPPPAPAPAGPSTEDLLTEIRDLLKSGRS